jgi:hypothetical protein
VTLFQWFFLTLNKTGLTVFTGCLFYHKTILIIHGNSTSFIITLIILCLGFPVDCDEAKYDRRYNIQKNGPQIIDIDGPDGSANPILVQCDMETYPHVGVSVIFHDR